MKLAKKITKAFRPQAAAGKDGVSASIAGMTTPAGRERHMKFLALHPECLNMTDARGKSALDHAAFAGDVETMAQLISAGIKQDFYHDAITAACLAGSRPALALLLAAGGVVTERHLNSMQTVARMLGDSAQGDAPPASGVAEQYNKSVAMMELAYRVQAENRAAEAAGPTVLGRDMNIRSPLKLKLPA